MKPSPFTADPMLRRPAKAILTTTLAALALGVVFIGSARAQNLVSNPNFSANAASFTEFPGYFTGAANPDFATGWIGGSGINGTLAPGTGNPFAPQNNVPSFLFMQGDISASQTIGTTAGTEYLFSFDAAARNAGDPAGVSVLPDNTQGAALVINGTSVGLSKVSFRKFAFAFTATGPQTIQFNSTGSGDHTTDITNVSVTPTGGGDFALTNGMNFVTDGSGTVARGFMLLGGDQALFKRPGTVTYTGNITTNGSGGSLSVLALGNQAGTQHLTFSGNTITLGAKSFQTNGFVNGNVDSIPDANTVRTTLDSMTLTTDANVIVTRSALHVTGTSQVTIGGQLISGDAWNDFTMSGNSVVTATGGVDFRNVASHLVLDGGTLNTPSIWGNTTFGGASRTIFNGTRVVATADNTDFLKMSNDFDLAAHSAAANIANGGAIFDTNGKNIAIQNVLSDLPGNNGTLTKLGAGTLMLTAGNSYTGTTTVSNGTLEVGGSIAASAVLVQGAGAILSGTGTVGAVTVDAGRLAPGASIGTLNSGSTTLNAGSIFALEIESSTNAKDVLSISGNLSLSDADDAVLSITDLAPGVYNGTPLAFITYTGGWDGDLFTYNASIIPDGGSLTVGANTYRLYYNFLGSNSVALVPEPGTAASLLLGAACLALRRRRV